MCHHALYLDRTFNAAHYLQSEDRIHRFGLSANQETRIEVVECLDSVDETVREMGADYWPYGLPKNVETLQTFLRYHHEQGLSKRLLKPEELFAPETLESFKI